MNCSCPFQLNFQWNIADHAKQKSKEKDGIDEHRQAHETKNNRQVQVGLCDVFNVLENVIVQLTTSGIVS